MSNVSNKQKLEDAIHTWFNAYNTRDYGTFVELEMESFGFGWRGQSFRDVDTRSFEEKKQGTERAYAALKDFSWSIDDEDVRLIDGVGFHSMIYTEKHTHKDGTRAHVSII